MPWQALLVQLLHEGIRIKLLDVPDTRLLPDAFHEQLGADHVQRRGDRPDPVPEGGIA